MASVETRLWSTWKCKNSGAQIAQTMASGNAILAARKSALALDDGRALMISRCESEMTVRSVDISCEASDQWCLGRALFAANANASYRQKARLSLHDPADSFSIGVERTLADRGVSTESRKECAAWYFYRFNTREKEIEEWKRTWIAERAVYLLD